MYDEDEPSDAEKLDWLRDPRNSLPAFAMVKHQENAQAQPFDPEGITYNLQNTLLAYYGDPPRENGKTKWLVLVKSRQAGASTLAEIAIYPKVAYTPGFDHICLADDKDRAEYLHGRVHFTHLRWPDRIRTPTQTSREVRQLTFDPEIGGKMRTLSLEDGAVGIGQTPQSLHWSEVPFGRDAARKWSTMQPGLWKNVNSLVCLESTPSPPDYPSAAFWEETYFDAKVGDGRWIGGFFPYWDSKLNRDVWQPDWVLENDEIRLLEKYGPLGLTVENLAFRRQTFQTDREIRKNPTLFDVWYPRDDLTCWGAMQRGVIPENVLRRHHEAVTIPWGRHDVYVEYAEPRPGAAYAIGVDPAGYGARDHAAFQVFEIWDGEWVQVATFASVHDPNAFARKLFDVGIRYNQAIIAVLRTGVGVGVTTLLIEWKYPRLLYDHDDKPGIAESAPMNERMLGYLTDALMDDLVLRDGDLVRQLASYKNDKVLEETGRAEMLRGSRPLRSRRERHHWDKVSALLAMVFVARRMPQHLNPANPARSRPPIIGGRSFDALTWNEQQQYHALVAKDKQPKTTLMYRSVRRR